MTQVLELPERLDLSAAHKLSQDLVATAADVDLTLDAAQVTHFGAICVQSVIAVARRQQAAGAQLQIDNVSERVEAQLGHMGLTPQNLMEGCA